jgi:hypothetical protein
VNAAWLFSFAPGDCSIHRHISGTGRKMVYMAYQVSYFSPEIKNPVMKTFQFPAIAILITNMFLVSQLAALEPCFPIFNSAQPSTNSVVPTAVEDTLCVMPSIDFEEEEYRDDIPFNTEEIARKTRQSIGLGTVFVMEEEHYVDDIPFDTGKVAAGVKHIKYRSTFGVLNLSSVLF